jgi:signal transduction histidine kinase
MVSWNNTLLHNVEGEIIGTISIGEDITERYQLERMKAEFISIVSHELRTPLTSMQAGLSLLHNNIITPSSREGKITLDIVTSGVNRLVRLVNDILDLERLESGKINLEIKHFDVIILMDTAIAQMQDLANEGGIIFKSYFQPCEINADPDRLLQVLINLISNAIKFSVRGSIIEISCDTELSSNNRQIEPVNSNSSEEKAEFQSENDRQYLLFKIKDQGRGIPKENLETIFERFQQVDSSDAREKGGTGLGLAICRSIVQQHGGRIWVESCLGEGSTFYFTIPIDYEANSNY